MRHTLQVIKSFLGHVPTAQAADYEHLLTRIGGPNCKVQIDTSDVNGEPNLNIFVSHSNYRRPFELKLTFTNKNFVHIEVATTRDGAAMFFGLADLLLKINVDIWDSITPRDMRAFAEGLETT